MTEILTCSCGYSLRGSHSYLSKKSYEHLQYSQGSHHVKITDKIGVGIS